MHEPRNPRNAKRLVINSAWAAGPTAIPIRIQHWKHHFLARGTAFSRQRVCVIFTAPFPQAHRVQLMGEFTQWEENPIEMDLTRSGFWFTAVHLPPGNHPYAYIVDGARRVDPEAPLSDSDPDAEFNCCRVGVW